MEKKEVVLRPYQKECVELMDKQENGHHLIVLATGLGKTVIGANVNYHGRVLWLSHRDELVRQPEKYFTRSFGIEKADETSNGEEVVSASVQTLSRPGRLRKFRPDDFETIVVDEAHHAAAPSYKMILNYFHPKRIFGFTATPKRGDRATLSDVFDDILYQKDIRWGIQNGYLSDVKCKRIFANVDFGSIHKSMGDFKESELEDALKGSNSVTVVAKAYMEYCYKEKRHTLLFAVSVAMCETIADAIRSCLPKDERNTVAVVTGGTPQEERNEILKNFSEGTVMCLVNCMVLTEGTDLPIADAVINMRPTANQSLYQQMVGRGLRINDGKKNCLVLDLVEDEEKTHILCTAPTLFGIDPAFLSKKQKKEMEDTELSKYADKLDEWLEYDERVAERMTLQADEFDAFTGEYLDRITAGSLPETPDFLKGFSVIPGPWENGRYSVRFDGGEIAMSEPDVLGVTQMRITKDGKLYAQGSVPANEARSLIRYFIEKKTGSGKPYLWDAEITKAWDAVPATSSQVWKINSLNGTVFHGAVHSSSLSKRQASSIIDLGVRAQELKSEAQKAAQKTKAPKASLKDAMERRSEKEKEEHFASLVMKGLRKELSDWENQKPENGIIFYHYIDNPKFQAIQMAYPATDNQMKYIDSLVRRMAASKTNLSEDIPNSLTAGEISVIIGFLKNLTDGGGAAFHPGSWKRVVDTKTMILQAQECARLGVKQYEMAVPYTDTPA